MPRGPVGAAAFAEPIHCSRRSSSSVPLVSGPISATQPSGHRSKYCASHHSKRCTRCVGSMPKCASILHRRSPRCEGSTSPQTPASSSFADWYKCGSRTRDTRFTRPLLYPSELTCGGMKQSGRAVRACATRSGAQARQVGLRTHFLCTIDVSTSSLDRGNSRSPILPLVHSSFSPPKTTRPRSAAPSGVSVGDCSGDCHLVSPATFANEANASQFPRRAEALRGSSRDLLRRLSAPSAAACKRLLIDDS